MLWRPRSKVGKREVKMKLCLVSPLAFPGVLIFYELSMWRGGWEEGRIKSLASPPGS